MDRDRVALGDRSDDREERDEPDDERDRDDDEGRERSRDDESPRRAEDAPREGPAEWDRLPRRLRDDSLTEHRPLWA